MARYNAWQNKGMKAAMESLTDADLRADRGAFFGSILKTANHLLWGDLIWMSRFDGGDSPGGSIQASVDQTATPDRWATERTRADERILNWAEQVRSDDLEGDLAWFSGALGREARLPFAECIVHMFNHQTHHRGQIHAMLTAAGAMPQPTDLFILPKEGPWL